MVVLVSLLMIRVSLAYVRDFRFDAGTSREKKKRSILTAIMHCGLFPQANLCDSLRIPAAAT